MVAGDAVSDTNKTLRAVVGRLLHKFSPWGVYGGPLVRVVAHYEDKTERSVGHELISAINGALAEAVPDGPWIIQSAPTVVGRKWSVHNRADGRTIGLNTKNEAHAVRDALNQFHVQQGETYDIGCYLCNTAARGTWMCERHRQETVSRAERVVQP